VHGEGRASARKKGAFPNKNKDNNKKGLLGSRLSALLAAAATTRRHYHA
jgi:hypothetical protein